MTRRTNISAVMFLGAITLLLSSCQYSLALWIVPGSTANNLVFGFSTSKGSDDKVEPSDIRIFPCASIKQHLDGDSYPGDHAAVWSAGTVSSKLPDPTNRLTYGQSPGLENRRGPLLLDAPGCYVVHAYARDSSDRTRSATVGFTIDENGAAREMSSGEYDNVFAQ